MKNFDNLSQPKNQRYFPLRHPDDPTSVDLIPVTEDQYQKLMRDVYRIRKREQRAVAVSVLRSTFSRAMQLRPLSLPPKRHGISGRSNFR